MTSKVIAQVWKRLDRLPAGVRYAAQEASWSWRAVPFVPFFGLLMLVQCYDLRFASEVPPDPPGVNYFDLTHDGLGGRGGSPISSNHGVAIGARLDIEVREGASGPVAVCDIEALSGSVEILSGRGSLVSLRLRSLGETNVRFTQCDGAERTLGLVGKNIGGYREYYYVFEDFQQGSMGPALSPCIIKDGIVLGPSGKLVVDLQPLSTRRTPISGYLDGQLRVTPEGSLDISRSIQRSSIFEIRNEDLQADTAELSWSGWAVVTVDRTQQARPASLKFWSGTGCKFDSAIAISPGDAVNAIVLPFDSQGRLLIQPSTQGDTVSVVPEDAGLDAGTMDETLGAWGIRLVAKEHGTFDVVARRDGIQAILEVTVR